MKKKDKQEKPTPLLNERPEAEQVHYQNVLLEEMRTHIKSIAEYMETRFDRVDREFESMQARFESLEKYMKQGFAKVYEDMSAIEENIVS